MRGWGRFGSTRTDSRVMLIGLWCGNCVSAAGAARTAVASDNGTRMAMAPLVTISPNRGRHRRLYTTYESLEPDIASITLRGKNPPHRAHPPREERGTRARWGQQWLMECS